MRKPALSLDTTSSLRAVIETAEPPSSLPGRRTFGSPPAARPPVKPYQSHTIECLGMSRIVFNPTPRLLIATTNRDKIGEIAQVLSGIPYAIVTLDAWPHVSPPAETARTFNENARDKARYYAAVTGELTVAEASG